MAKIETHTNFRVKEFLVDSPKVIFVFSAMGTKIALYRLFAKLMNRKGYSCIVYDYPLEILFKPTLRRWRQFYDDIIDDAQQRLRYLQAHDRRYFYAYGVSMGTLIANKFTRDTVEIKHVILNLTYGDVAQNIWTWKGVKKAKHGLLAQGIDEAQLRQNLSYTDPITTVSGLKGRKVLLQLSRPDRVLVYDQTMHTKRAFEQAGLNMTYHENKYLGHYLAGTKNILSIKAIDRFYKS